MSEERIDLNEHMVKEMKKLELDEQNIAAFQTSRHFQTAVGQEPLVQKTYLTMALYDVLNNSAEVVPPQIRLGLNMGVSVKDWLDDAKLIVLPFIKANEDKFFKPA